MRLKHKLARILLAAFNASWRPMWRLHCLLDPVCKRCGHIESNHFTDPYNCKHFQKYYSEEQLEILRKPPISLKQ